MPREALMDGYEVEWVELNEVAAVKRPRLLRYRGTSDWHEVREYEATR